MLVTGIGIIKSSECKFAALSRQMPLQIRSGLGPQAAWTAPFTVQICKHTHYMLIEILSVAVRVREAYGLECLLGSVSDLLVIVLETCSESCNGSLIVHARDVGQRLYSRASQTPAGAVQGLDQTVNCIFITRCKFRQCPHRRG